MICSVRCINIMFIHFNIAFYRGLFNKMVRKIYRFIILKLIAWCITSCLMLVSCSRKTILAPTESSYTLYSQGLRIEKGNACIGMTVIGYYDNKIYYRVRNNIDCMNMDDSNYKIVKTLYKGYNNNYKYFHDGYYYYVITKAGTIHMIGNDDSNLYRVKLMMIQNLR